MTYHIDVERFERMAKVSKVLQRLRFDEHGNPTTTLPECPQCEENELHVSGADCTARCLRCNWRCIWNRELDA